MKKIFTYLLGVLLLVSPLFAQEAASEKEMPLAGELAIAAAADLRFALDALAKDFKTRHPSIEIKPSYGSSGSFYAMLKNQAPFDLFLSADVQYPRKLAEAGLGADTKVFIYAVGRLAIWVPRTSRVDVRKLGMKALLDPSIRKVAIANPLHAPYGRAAEAAMKRVNIYDAVQPRLVFGENITQALQFVQSGAADIGIIALSLAEAPQIKNEGSYWEVPLDSYPRMEQGGLILKWTRNPAAARVFRDFLTSDAGRAGLKRFGFYFPEQ